MKANDVHELTEGPQNIWLDLLMVFGKRFFPGLRIVNPCLVVNSTSIERIFIGEKEISLDFLNFFRLWRYT